MELTDPDNLPVVLIVGALVLVIVLWLFSGLRRPRSGRNSAEIIAAVQAERDVLRANHAVEIATLEGKLAEAQTRLQKEMGATFRLKELEHKLATASERAEADATALARANRKIEELAAELEGHRERNREVPRLVSERDRAREEMERQSETITKLRGDLQETINKLSRSTAERENSSDIIERLTRERDETQTALERQKTLTEDARRDVHSLSSRLAEANRGQEGVADLKAEIERLKGRTVTLTQAVNERDVTIHELRNALERAQRDANEATTTATDEAEVTALRKQVEDLTERAQKANEALSRLAYDRDGLRNRLDAAERVERESRAEVEKREALLELRLQKIYELEARLRDQHGQIHGALRRAEVAEQMSAALRESGDADDIEAATAARIKSLETALEESGLERQRLQGELEAALAQAPTVQSYEEAREAAEALSAAQAEVEELRAEVSRLRAGTAPNTRASAAEVVALREAIRKLGERFMAEAEPAAVAGPREPTLAERIRAFKASRDAQMRRPLRIAAPKDR